MARVWLKRLDETKTTGSTKASRTKSGALTERKSRLTFSFGVDLEKDIETKALIGQILSFRERKNDGDVQVTQLTRKRHHMPSTSRMF